MKDMKQNLYRTLTGCLFGLFCILLPVAATAQFHIGLQSGIVFSKAAMTSKSNDLGYLNYAYPTPTLNYIMTNATNLYLSYTLTPAFTLAVEPGYMQKSNEQNVGLNYIQLPVLAEYTLIDRLRLTAGPELNFLLNNDIEKSYKGLDVAIQVGAYYGVYSTFDLGVKYSRSTGTFLKHDIVSSGSDINFYHYYFQFFTRYKF